jgi:hypothetical protein
MRLNNNIFQGKKKERKKLCGNKWLSTITASLTDRSVDSKGRVIYKSIVSVDG